MTRESVYYCLDKMKYLTFINNHVLRKLITFLSRYKTEIIERRTNLY